MQFIEPIADLKKMFARIFWKKYGMAMAIAVGSLFLAGISLKVISANSVNRAKTPSKSSHLDLVKKRGYLICGISGKLPGFSFVDATGTYVGLDVDLCRAVAAALFDDPTKVEFVKFDTGTRFSALRSQKIDLLSRNTTNSLSRDTKMGLEFTPTIFYDAQGFMVARNSNINSLADLAGKSICIAGGTPSLSTLNERFKQLKLEYKPVLYDDNEALFGAYEHGRCAAITRDISQLAIYRKLLANPKQHQILAETLSKEPLAPAVKDGDSSWADVVKWVTYATIQAEELDIDSENINIYRNTKDGETRRFLGIEGELGSQMGLSDDFAVRVIKHVGNYREIYERNLGKPFGLKRGQNALWFDGGLMYSPPFR